MGEEGIEETRERALREQARRIESRGGKRFRIYERCCQYRKRTKVQVERSREQLTNEHFSKSRGRK